MAKKKAAKKVGGKKTEAPKVIAASKLNTEQAMAELAQLSKEVDFQGADFTTMSLADLRKAVSMGRQALKAPAPEAPATPAVGAAAEANTGDEPVDPGAGAPQAPTNAGDSVDIVSGDAPNTRYIRTFSKEVHGDDFKKLAENYVAKHKGGIVPSKSVKAVRVRWEEVERGPEGQILNDGRMVPKNETFAVASQEAKEDALALAARKGGSVFVFEGKVK